jgi:molybdopterin molybdotransferase
MRRKPGRTEFVPVRLCKRDACLWAERAGPDGSGRLAPLLEATGLAVLPAREEHIRTGDALAIIPFMPGAIQPGPAMRDV